MYMFPSWIATPENLSAFTAVRTVADCLGANPPRPIITPLFLHGPTGVGKTHLVTALAAEVALRRPESTTALLPARGLGEALRAGQEAMPEQISDREAARSCDLLIVEDLQHLPEKAAAALGRLLDFRFVRERPVVLTSAAGPAQLTHLPVRLTSRLAAGLVVTLAAYGPASRRLLLKTLAERRQLAVSTDVLDWLAENTTGSARQLEGALVRLEALARLTGGRLDLATVRDHFGGEVETGGLTLERIAEHVAHYFQVKVAQIRSSQRGRRVLHPRQVAIYLARQLTGLSLADIGAWFGGRDHSTVLHACRKVEQALTEDPALGGVVRSLKAELSGSLNVRQAG